MQAERAQDAFSVASGLLEATGAALRDDDFASFARCFHLPASLATIDGVRALQTSGDLHKVYQQIRGHYTSMQMHQLKRHIAAALFDGPDLVRSCHVTRFLDDSARDIRPAVASLSLIERIDGVWQITRTQYTIHTDSAHGRALLGETRRVSPETAMDSAAESVFQALLDRVTRAYLEGRADLMLDTVRLPFFVQGSHSTKVMTTAEDVTAEFRLYVTRFLVHRVTDTVRRVLHAEMVGDRRIQGAFRTHVLCGTQLVIPSYTSAMTLEQGPDQIWRCTSVIHPMGELTVETLSAQDGSGPGLPGPT